jgi:hypothetical protein
VYKCTDHKSRYNLENYLPSGRQPTSLWTTLKRAGMLDPFITSQKQNDMQTFMQATVSRWYLVWYYITATRGKVSHRVIIMAAVSSKWEVPGLLMSFMPVAATVFKSYICLARWRNRCKWTALLTLWFFESLFYQTIITATKLWFIRR